MEIHVTTAGRRIRSCGREKSRSKVKVGCFEPINAGDIIARGVWWHEKKRWQISWHFQCWADTAVARARDNPRRSKIRGTKGRDPLDLTSKEMRLRRLLLVKASKLRRQRKEQGDIFYPDYLEEFYRSNKEFDGKLKVVWDELVEIGGPPHKSFSDWVTNYSPSPGSD